MKKYLFFRFLLIVFSWLNFLSADAQSLQLTKGDSVRIEKLKSGLPQLSGKAKVDRLNAIAEEYSWASPRISESFKDYATKAYNEAKAINYQEGLGYAATYLASHYIDSTISGKYSQEAISVAKATNNNKMLGLIYYELATRNFRYFTKSIELAKTSLSYSTIAGDVEGQAEASNWLSFVYSFLGRYDEGFPYCEMALNVLKKKWPGRAGYKHYLIQQSLAGMSELYQQAGDYETAMNYLRQARQYAIKNNLQDKMDYQIGQLYNKTGLYDSALYYLNASLKTSTNFFGPIDIAKTYLLTKQYDKAMELFDAHKYWGSSHVSIAPKVHLGTASVYEAKGNYTEAMKSATRGLELAIRRQRPDDLLEAYQLMSKIQHNLGRNDSAYYYQQKYIAFKDSITSKQFLWRLNNKLYQYKKIAGDQKKALQISLLQKDNLIKEQQLQQQILLQQQSDAQVAILNKNSEIQVQQLQIKDQKLKEEMLLKDQKQTQLTLLEKDNKIKDERLKQQSFIKNALLTGLFLLLVVGFLIVTWLSLKRKNERLKNEKKQAELQQQSAELEMQALRAQMNPHFIFNCLSSINKFILKNESRAASDYLTRFSRLIRRVLTNSQLSMIPLSDEIEMLRLYLDMERLRFSNSFNYNIVYANDIEPESIYVPPMLLQPFCENAIWHGLMHKEDPGQLDVVMRTENNMLNCTITDNGIGREKASELKSKSGQQHKSFGLKITTERLSFFNQQKSIDSFYKAEDILNEEGYVSGTKVNLNIRYKDQVDVPVKVAV